MDQTARPRLLKRSVAELATPADDTELRRLLQEAAVPGQLSIAYTREPDFFRAAAVEGDEHQTVVRRQPDGHIIAMGTRSVRTSFINGQACRLGYFGQLRVAASQRGRPGMIASGLQRLREVHDQDNVRLYLTSIIENNHAARRLLEAGLPGWPIHRPLDTLITWVIPTRTTSPRAPAIRLGRTEDWPAIATFLQQHHRQHQFAPCWTEAELRSPIRCRDLAPENFLLWREQGVLAGCLALWDQRGFKQNVVTRYPPSLAWQRPWLNALSHWFPLLHWPSPGTPFAHAFVSHVAVDSPDILLALLDAARWEGRRRGLDAITLGLMESHPLCSVVRWSTRAMEYRSTVYVAFWEDGRMAADALDHRLPHVEVALL